MRTIQKLLGQGRHDLKNKSFMAFSLPELWALAVGSDARVLILLFNSMPLLLRLKSIEARKQLMFLFA